MPEYVCYCAKVTNDAIRKAVLEDGAKNIEEVIEKTGAMKNSDCKKNNPKGTCCYPDILDAFNKLRERVQND